MALSGCIFPLSGKLAAKYGDAFGFVDSWTARRDALRAAAVLHVRDGL